MAEVILHLGLAKTGTSWMQKYLFPAMDLNYVKVGSYDILPYQIKEKTLFSFEGLSGTPHRNDRYVLASRLHRMFPYAKVFVLFRDKESYIRSLYSTYLKGGGILEFDEFHGWLTNHPYFMNWDLYKQYLIKLWGRSHCRFYQYEHVFGDLNSLFFFYDLSEFTGAAINMDYSKLICKRVNKSFDKRQQQIWLRVNRFFKSKWNKGGLLPRALNPCYLYWMVNKHYG